MYYSGSVADKRNLWVRNSLRRVAEISEPTKLLPLERWENIPRSRKEDLIRLLTMESEGGGWIPNDLFEDDPEEAEAQADAIKALVTYLGAE